MDSDYALSRSGKLCHSGLVGPTSYGAHRQPARTSRCRVDQELVLDLARKSADAVIHAAAPVTAFMVGYAAGLEAGKGSRGSDVLPAVATNKAADIAFKLCSDRAEGKGWEPTNQS
ncbi:DUF6457 domain-containing protein [Paenarthrobacter sp. NPDC092416]|uniref:DUF6457 domain-containing protein n=1 Tax=Paenarthrobacter sp. NPDC092416 TaxID=3364386 RepID=UPI00382BE602